MPDLGKYATEVLSAYAISLAFLFGLIALTIVQHRRAKRALERAENG